MGLDQYAYSAMKAGQRAEFYESGDLVYGEFVNKKVTKPRDIAYWRKHPNMQGWMRNLWQEKNPGSTEVFNGVEVELTWEDLDRLQADILNENMSKLGTTGFFFGNPSDSIYREQDLQFIKDAKAELFLGLKVFYNSSW